MFIIVWGILVRTVVEKESEGGRGERNRDRRREREGWGKNTETETREAGGTRDINTIKLLR